MKLFVSCTKGLEKALAEEITELGYPQVKVGSAGVYVEGDERMVYRLNYESRLASRVLLPLKSFRCMGSRDLYKEAKSVPWQDYMRPGKTFAIDFHVAGNREFRNGLYAAQVFKDAICDRVREFRGNRPSVDVKTPDVQFHLLIEGTRATISLDTSGAPLHQRGYRVKKVAAPMRENLAAGLLRLAGFKEGDFLDPCCGSGTLLIEAAWMLTRTPPGCLRNRWGFQSWPGYKAAVWQEVKAEADSRRQPLSSKLVGIDKDSKALQATRANLAAARVEGDVELFCKEFQRWEGEADCAFLLTNPPYGKRLDEVHALEALYEELGDFCKHRVAKPGKAAIFTANLPLAKKVGLRTAARHILSQGGMEARLLCYDLF